MKFQGIERIYYGLSFGEKEATLVVFPYLSYGDMITYVKLKTSTVEFSCSTFSSNYSGGNIQETSLYQPGVSKKVKKLTAKRTFLICNVLSISNVNHVQIKQFLLLNSHQILSLIKFKSNNWNVFFFS